MSIVAIQLLISAFGILLSGLTGYMGIRIALAEVRRDITALNNIVNKVESRLNRLEEPYFKK